MPCFRGAINNAAADLRAGVGACRADLSQKRKRKGFPLPTGSVDLGVTLSGRFFFSFCAVISAECAAEGCEPRANRGDSRPSTRRSNSESCHQTVSMLSLSEPKVVASLEELCSQCTCACVGFSVVFNGTS